MLLHLPSDRTAASPSPTAMIEAMSPQTAEPMLRRSIDLGSRRRDGQLRTTIHRGHCRPADLLLRPPHAHGSAAAMRTPTGLLRRSGSQKGTDLRVHSMSRDPRQRHRQTLLTPRPRPTPQSAYPRRPHSTDPTQTTSAFQNCSDRLNLRRDFSQWRYARDRAAEGVCPCCNMAISRAVADDLRRDPMLLLVHQFQCTCGLCRCHQDRGVRRPGAFVLRCFFR